MLYIRICFVLSLIFGNELNSGHAQDVRFLKDHEYDNFESGYCVELQKCAHAMKLIDDHQYLRQISCGYNGREPKVICPSSKKFIDALCGHKLITPSFEQNILGGVPVEVGEIPFQAVLGYPKGLDDDDVDYNCGGSLIADDIVLTAAHCVNKAIAPTIVKLGKTSVDNDPKDTSIGGDIQITKIIIHSEYSPDTRQNDIALLKLERPATLIGTNIQTICLSSNETNIDLHGLTVTGFGIKNNITGEKSTWLLKGTVEEYPFQKCHLKHKALRMEIVESQICGSSSIADSCEGDSGGPMFYKKDGSTYQYGIVSYGIGCGTVFPSVYTKVSKFLGWIAREMSLVEE